MVAGKESVPVEADWDEKWFFETKTTEYHHGIARIAALLSEISYIPAEKNTESNELIQTYRLMGFKDPDIFWNYTLDYTSPTEGNNQAAYSFASKDVQTPGGTKKLVFIMKYIIVSDIHGSISALDKVLAFFEREKGDMLLILGDILNYGPRNRIPGDTNPAAIVERLNAMAERIVAVRGNCDSEVDQMLLSFPMMADYTIVVDNGKKLFLTHGHKYGESSFPLGADALFCGHTHLWKLERNADGLLVQNAVVHQVGTNGERGAVPERNILAVDGGRLEGCVYCLLLHVGRNMKGGCKACAHSQTRYSVLNPICFAKVIAIIRPS